MISFTSQEKKEEKKFFESQIFVRFQRKKRFTREKLGISSQKPVPSSYAVFWF